MSITDKTAKEYVTRERFGKPKCNFCEEEIKSNHISRWASHLRGCVMTPTLVKQKLRIRKTAQRTFQDHSLSQLTGNKRDRDDFDNESLDEAVFDLFVESALPFRVADTPAFKRLFTRMSVDYNPPSAKSLGNSLLEKKIEEMEIEIKNLLEKAQFISIVTDGWQNLNSEHLVSFSVICDNFPSPVLLDTIDTSSYPQTAQNIAKDISRCIHTCGVQKVISVTSDNCNAMKAAWAIIATEFPHITASGCSAHTFNLIAKAICAVAMRASLVYLYKMYRLD
jgi:hypothetical protein